MTATPDPYLTVAEVADILRLTERTVRLMCRRGELPAGRVGRQHRIDRPAFERYRANLTPSNR